MSAIEMADYSNHLWWRDIRTLYNVNRGDEIEFLQLASRTDVSMATEVFPLEACQDARIRLRQGELAAPNAVVRVPGDQ